MSAPLPLESSIVDVDAVIVFRHPFRAMVLMTFVVGALDAIGFERFGVFTANQAGNLVIGWTLLATDAGAAGLAVASIVGCALGVATVVSVRRAWGWLAGASGSRWLLGAAGLLIIGAALATERLAPAASVLLTAFSVAVLGMVFVSGGGVRAPVLASTNSFVDAVRYSTAAALVRPSADWRRRARRAAAFPAAWTLGAATAAFQPVPPVVAALGAGVLVIVVAAMADRVGSLPPAA